MINTNLNKIYQKKEQARFDNVIKGHIYKIIFQKENFIIAVIQTSKKEELKIKGNMLSFQIHVEYTFNGKWESHSNYGNTFAFTDYKATYPKELSAIRSYLIDNCKWIGPEIGSNIVKVFKEKTLETCKDNPELVASSIRGITIPRAKEISDMLKNNESNEELLIKLKQMLSGTKTSKRSVNEIIFKYGGDAIVIIEKNPYLLIDDIEGIGFLTADRIARNSDLDYKSNERIEAGIIHTMKESASSGHTYLPRHILTREVASLLNGDINILQENLVTEEDTSKIIDKMLKEKK